MSEWTKSSLGEITKYVNRGFSPRYVEKNGDLIINQKCIRNGRIDLMLAKYTDKTKSITAEKILQADDILINSTGIGTAGRVAKFHHNIKATVDSHVTIVRINKALADPTFIFYNLRAREDEIESFAEGSTGQIELGRERVKIIDILLPLLPEQKAIAEILSSLDDKIDLLHRQNKTLEAMAETLFREWFVLNGKFICKITDFVEFNPKRKLSKGTNAPYLEMANICTSVFHPDDWYERKFTSGTKFINGDTLLARITPCLENGKASFVTFLQDEQIGWGSTEFIVMRSKEKYHPFLAYTLARNDDFRGYAEGCLEGSSGRQRVNIDHLMNYELYFPSEEKILEFNKISDAIVKKIDKNFRQIENFRKLRDILLPKLMSGEIKI